MLISRKRERISFFNEKQKKNLKKTVGEPDKEEEEEEIGSGETETLTRDGAGISLDDELKESNNTTKEKTESVSYLFNSRIH